MINGAFLFQKDDLDCYGNRPNDMIFYRTLRKDKMCLTHFGIKNIQNI